jgi:RNA polymerase sigma factor (sigma-70 family)
MTSQAVGVITRPLRALWDLGVVGGLSDTQLLDQVANGPTETVEPAFQALVERHGPMVLQVCRRVLVDPNDADDAFQATFLVLFRRARSVRNRGSIASWLHGVALRNARRANVEAARRRRIEARHGRSSVRPPDDAGRHDLASLVHRELDRLPEKYRAPIVLCYLEGLTHERASQQLGWPIGTVRGRLSRARDLLRKRLSRRGITEIGALFAIKSLTEPLTAGLPAALCDAAIRAVAEVAGGHTITAVTSARVAAWIDADARAVALSYWRISAALLILIGTIGGYQGLRIRGTAQSHAKHRDEPVAARGAREANLRELLQLKGTWTRSITDTPVVSGVPQAPNTYKLIWSIDRDLITDAGRDRFADHTYRISVDPDRSPKTINLTCLNNGIILWGIYKLDGETLTLCYAYANGHRPTEFRDGPDQVQAIFHRESRIPVPLAQQHANATGCYWLHKPSEVPQTGMMGDWFWFHGDGVQLSLRKDLQGGTMIIMAYVTKYDQRHRPMAEYHPVIFDDLRARHVPRRVHGSPSESASVPGVLLGMFEYHLDLPRDRVKKCGIEVVPAEDLRSSEEDESARAYREARAAGIELLPRPEVGKRLEFSFTLADGTVLSSKALFGKVVLVLCWATEFEGSSEETRRLKALYDRRHREGFEVVGLNFDRNRVSGERYAKSRGLRWPQVFVPADGRTWNLWSKVSGFPRFPGLLLIDREGVLSWDGNDVSQRDERINALLDATRTGK